VSVTKRWSVRSWPWSVTGAPGPRWAWLLLGGVLLAGALVAVLAWLAGTGPYTALGNTDPGPVVRLGTPLLRLLVDLSATLCTGSLACTAFCSRPDSTGALTPLGYATLRDAARWAVLWAVATLLLIPFDVADTAGQPLADTLAPAHLVALTGALEEPKAWLVTAVVAVLVAVGGRLTLRWQPAVALLGLAVFGLLPALATGHSSSDAGHDIAIAAIMIHVPAAAIWLGVLVAFLRYGRRSDATIGRRYARIAEVCWVVLVASGVVDALLLVPAGQLVGTSYGLVLLAKLVLTGAVGLIALRGRRRVLASRSRLVGIELLALAGAFALSIGLTHLPPPAFVGRPVTAQETLLGYDLAGPPTLLRLVLDWRIDALFGPLAVLLAVGYLLAARRVGGWPVGRTVSWLAGCLVLLVATSSGIGRYAAAMFSLHITAHMLIGMLAPILFALGGPLTLARQAAPPAASHWLDALGESAAVRALTQPIAALTVFAGAPFALYFTGLFDAAVRFHWAHLIIDAVFLVIGYLFVWPVIGVDPTPRPLPNLARLGMVLAAMPFDILFGALLISTHRVIGNGSAGSNFYQALALPWVHSLLADQRTAGEIALAVGEVCLLLVIAALLLRWQRVDEPADEAGLDDYQRILAELARHR
jgi:putative copper resistance protein D